MDIPTQRTDKRLPVDEAARALARRLVRSARHAALATLCPETGAPLASRVSVASDASGQPLILISDLAQHTPALRADRRCSLLFGEPEGGDPLAHPRVSVSGTAQFVGRDDLGYDAARTRFLARHPAAALYADFADFHLVTIAVDAAALNGGFARAYALNAADIVDAALDAALSAGIARAIKHMNEDHQDAIDAYAKDAGETGEGWTIVSGDRRGFEMARNDCLCRMEFPVDVTSPSDLRAAYVALAKQTA